MLTNRLDNLTNTDNQYDITIQNILYKKELLRGLETLKNKSENLSEYSALDEFLIYLNFNSKAYINRFTQNIAIKVNSYKNLSERIDQLLLHHKSFNQLHRKPDIILNPKYHGLEIVLGNWFQEEIMYLERKMHLSVVPLNVITEEAVQKNSLETEKQKVLCGLSTDQIALFLRASWDLKILVAKSLNLLFKSFVPSISTAHKYDLSPDAMRSKAYVAEQRDKEILIETLECIIQQIRKYN